MRALVGTALQVRAAVQRLHTALGLPRCGRLAGVATLDGQPPPADACPCTDVGSPTPGCRFATRRRFAIHRASAGNLTRWIIALRNDTREDVRFTATQRSLIIEIPDGEVEADEAQVDP